MEYYNKLDWNKDEEKSQNNSDRKGNDDIISLVITEDSVYEYDIDCLKKNKKYKKY